MECRIRIRNGIHKMLIHKTRWIFNPTDAQSVPYGICGQIRTPKNYFAMDFTHFFAEIMVQKIPLPVSRPTVPGTQE
jgi:hypothetical protein